MDASWTAYYDSETLPIGLEHGAAPPMACAQFGWGRKDPVEIYSLISPELEDKIRAFLARPRIVAHNAAFDMAVLVMMGFRREVFEAYDEGRIECTLVNQRLIDIAMGNGLHHKYNLAACMERNDVAFVVDKSDPWRTRYGELMWTAPEQWPLEAYRYAHDDIVALRLLDAAHDEARELDVLVNAGWFARNAFWHYLCTLKGLHTDPVQVARYEKVVHSRMEAEKAALVEAGLVWGQKPERVKGVKAEKWGKPGGRNTKAAQARMLEVMGDWARRTPKDGVSLDEEACTESGDKLLMAYQAYGSAKGRLSRIQALKAGRLHPSYVYPLETTRMSCRKASTDADESDLAGDQVQNPPKEPGYRECVVPSSCERVICSTDFSAYETVGWSQACHYRIGFSDMAEALIKGRDIHVHLGVEIYRELYDTEWGRENGLQTSGFGPEITYEQLLKAAKKDKLKWASDIRNELAKRANFGLMGGMGAETFAKTCRKQGMPISVELCEKIRNAWLRAWEQARPYLQWVERVNNEAGEDGAVVKCVASGTYRGGMRYSQIANNEFQKLCAMGFMDAGWALTWECWMGTEYWDRGRPSVLADSWMLVPLHDEFLMEHPKSLGHECGLRQAEVQMRAARKWFPNMEEAVVAEPALMERWTKGADIVKDATGRIIPWEPSDKGYKIKWGAGWDAWFQALEGDIFNDD
jgi:hypothetical protein